MTTTTQPGPSGDGQATEGVHSGDVETSLAIGGMTCASCVGRVTKALNRVDGVVVASVNLATETATVAHYPSLAPVTDLTAAVVRAGYTATPKPARTPAPAASPCRGRIRRHASRNRRRHPDRARPDLRALPGVTELPDPDRLADDVRRRCGIALSPGADFGSNGAGHVRLNFATDPEALREAVRRLSTYAPSQTNTHPDSLTHATGGPDA